METVQPPVDIVYSSPFYRCVQTIEPIAIGLRERQGRQVEIRAEPGFGYVVVRLSWTRITLSLPKVHCVPGALMT